MTTFKTVRIPIPNQLPSGLTKAIAFSNTWDGICRIDDEPTIVDDPTPPAPSDDNSGLKSALEKEREQRKEFEKQLRQMERQVKAFQELGNPEDIQKAIAIAQQQEELEEKRSRERLELEESLRQKYEPELQSKAQELAKVQAEFADYQLTSILQEAYLQCDGIPGEFVAVAHALKGRVKIENGKAIVINENGEPDFYMDNGKHIAKPVSRLISELKTDPKYLWFARHFKGAIAPGFGSQNNGVVSGDPRLQGLSGWDRVTALRELNGKA